MPSTTPTEEQKQVKRLLVRWRNFYFKTISPFLLIQALLTASYFLLWRLSPPVFVPMLCAIAGFPVIFFGVRYVTHKFAQQMTIEERNVLESCSHTSLSGIETSNLLKIRKAYDQINPKDVLLRSSQQTESSDTLLRAAAQSDNTPQDQLLCPSRTDPAEETVL